MLLVRRISTGSKRLPLGSLASSSGFEALEANEEEAAEAASVAELAQQVAADVEGACSSRQQHQQQQHQQQKQKRKQQQQEQQQEQQQQQQRDICRLVEPYLFLFPPGFLSSDLLFINPCVSPPPPPPSSLLLSVSVFCILCFALASPLGITVYARLEVLFGASTDLQDNAEVTAVSVPRSSSSSSSSRRSAAAAGAANTAAAAAAAGSRRLVDPDVVFDKCPLTQEPFRTPVSQRREGSIACPFAGCKGQIRRSELRRDVETEEHARRMRLREANEMQKKDAAVAAEAARVGVGLPSS
ncbi:hypothetical protein ACSSS7_000755 [Eimeria intestinalis]